MANENALAPHLRLGRDGEELAASFLIEKGWEIEDRNYTIEMGEIDIIASRPVADGDGDGTLVAFVEVKSRQRSDELTPELGVTARKRRNITRIARYYVAKNERRRTGYRFDVISVDFGQDPPLICHFEGAFDAGGNPY